MKPPAFKPDWPDDVQALYRHDMQEIWDRSIAPQIWNQYHNQLRVYFSLLEGRGPLDILDAGCAQGTLALLLAEKGHKVQAIDIRPQFLEYAASRYERGDISFICGNVLDMKLDEKFDLIFANQIVEHMVYPLDLVRRLSCMLKPGGRLAMTTPNGRYVKNSLPRFSELGDVVRYSNLQFSADADGHFFAYRDKELREIFEKAGLSQIHVSFFETPFISGHMKIRYLHGLVPVPILRLLDRLLLKMPRLRKSVAHQLMIVGTLPAL